MTIRELKEQGVCLQGWIRVNKWDSKMEESKMISYSFNTDGENIYDEALDLEIKYMYPEDNEFIIEVIGKELKDE